MIVYGDHPRQVRPPAVLDAIEAAIDGLENLAGIERHAALVAILIEAGELAQGLADDGFVRRGARDARSPDADAAMALVSALARAVATSWAQDFEADAAPARAALAALRALAMPDAVGVKSPEGFAFYALYPETFSAAAAALAGGDVRVIGLRSIGTTLAAMVAAGVGAPPPLTLRPIGHPFGREVALDPALAAELRGCRGATIAVVDEGPGMSGSSVAAVVDALVRIGHAPGRIHILPGHANGPGARADERIQAIWRRHPTHVRTFEDVVLDAVHPGHRLSTWVSRLVGPLTGPLRDISGGAWRALRYQDEADWPPVHPWQERRKFLGDTADATWLVKFVGLGRPGHRAFARARRLAEAGFSPAPAGLCHGFLVERWRGDTRPLDPTTYDRSCLVSRLGSYLAFRARAFPSNHPGASPGDLMAMARHNAGAALGPEAERAVACRIAPLPALAARARPVETDNRLHVWEWLDSDVGLLKSDAVDHHAGHDLIGCQDIAWDVAGASVEFALDRGERRALAGLIEREAGVPVEPDRVAVLAVCYAAFQLGAWTMAGETAGTVEAARIGTAVRRYADALSAALSC